MKKYEVLVPISGWRRWVVEAETPEEADDKVWKTCFSLESTDQEIKIGDWAPLIQELKEE